MIFDGFEFGCAARTIWGEARGEGDAGMRAVAHVLLNRLIDGRWGKALGAVCLAPYQFSCWNASDPNRALMLNMFTGNLKLGPCIVAFGDANAERDKGIDPTNGAMWYFADTILPPAWADPAHGAVQTAHIGHHIFFKGVR